MLRLINNTGFNLNLNCMKIICIFIASFLIFPLSYAQYQGNIKSKVIKPKANIEILYIYHHPKHLIISNKIYASVVYYSKKYYNNKVIPITKVDNSYQFLFKAPDSTQVLIFSIIDDKKNTINNNNGSGFRIYLYDNNGTIPASARITTADLLSYYAPRILKLNRELLKEQVIKLYKEGYKLSPSLKNGSSYTSYLNILYEEKKDAVKPKLLAYANQMALAQNDEQKWINAISIYRLLKMDEEKQKVEKKILSANPNGQWAIRKFWDKFYSIENPTENSILSSMDEYISRFKDTSNSIKDQFYANVISSFLNKKELGEVKKYELSVLNKNSLIGFYNNFAWKLSGKELYNSGSDLEIAKSFSKKSLDYSEEQMKNIVVNDEQGQYFQSTQNMCADTYALILYKLGQYDSAFYYQNAIYQQGGEADPESLERYVTYAEKVKGPNYAKQVIEQELLSGVNSPVMLKQLQSIYKQLNLPEDEFTKLQEKSNLLSRQKASEIIRAKLGTTKAKNFILKNILGQEVSLFSFSNKVIVIDFWATWCAPCRASFPVMQEAINKYKDDSEVIFLFIDVWENKEPEEMQKTAAKFIKDNNYSFNVLLDVTDKVVTDYRVETIPTKFIIDKKGNIVFMGNSSNIALEIENAKK